MRKLKQSVTKSSKTKLNTIQIDKLLRFLLYLQEMLVNMISKTLVNKFLTGKDVSPEKVLLEKATAIKRFEYSPLDKKLKAQTSAAE